MTPGHEPGMRPDQSDMLTDKQRENSKSRILSDAELIKGGADIDAKGILQPTDGQIKDAKVEMGEHFYDKSKSQEEELQKTREELGAIKDESDQNLTSYYDKEVVNGFLIEVVLDKAAPAGETRYSLLVGPQGAPLEGEDAYFEDDHEAKAAFQAAERFAKEEGTDAATILDKATAEATESAQ